MFGNKKDDIRRASRKQPKPIFFIFDRELKDIRNAKNLEEAKEVARDMVRGESNISDIEIFEIRDYKVYKPDVDFSEFEDSYIF